MRTRNQIGLIAAPCVVVFAMAGLWGARSLREQHRLKDLPILEYSGMPASMAQLLKKHESRVLERSSDSERWGEFGAALLANEALAESVPCFRRAMELNSTNSVWPHLLGIALRGSDRMEAQKAFSRAIQLNPMQVASLCALAEISLEEGNIEEALATAQLARQTTTNDPHVFFLLARALAENGNDKESLAAARQAKRLLKRARGDVEQFLMRLCARTGDEIHRRKHEETLSLISSAERGIRWPDPVYAICAHLVADPKKVANAAQAEVHRGNFDRAIEMLDELPLEDQKLAGPASARAMAIAHQGNPLEAIRILDQTDSHHGPTLESKFARGVVLLGQLKTDQAEVAFAEACKLDPSFEAAFTSRAASLMQMGRFQDALAVCESALRINTGSTDALLRSAMILIKLGQNDRAKKKLDKAKLLEPGHPAIKEAATMLGNSANDGIGEFSQH